MTETKLQPQLKKTKLTKLTKQTPNLALTTQQLHILKIIYKFRFVTANRVAEYRDVSTRTTNEALSILLNRDLITRKYDKSYKLLGKGARYFLTPKASKLLKPEPNINEQVLHTRYKDRYVSEAFVEHSIEIMAACLDIRSSYPDAFTIFSKAESAGHNFMPKPLPDLYLRRNKTSEEAKQNTEVNNKKDTKQNTEANKDTKKLANKETKQEANQPKYYFIDLIPDNLFFITKKRINQYFDHFESGDWGGGQYPTILLICQSKTVIKKANEHIKNSLDDRYLYDYEVPIKAILKTELIGHIKTS